MTIVGARFWIKVDMNGGLFACWPWMGARTERGYGRFGLGGKNRHAHRVAWELTYGPIPAGLWVLHHCDNPACVHPDHLFLGTHADNMADMSSKRRQAKQHPNLRGELNGATKLTRSDVVTIREVLAAGGRSSELARRFGVSRRAISLIASRTTWSWL